MKKIFLLATTLLLSISSFAVEYINDKYCIYRIDVGNQTAEVVNFCSEATAITIPASFVYQGDKYIVEGIGYFNFESNYDSKYCYYDYKSIRSKIIELNLPRTLKEIDLFAFKDMTRLKKITIPSGVSQFKDHIFSGNSRLEYIILEGVPCCEHSDFGGAWKTHRFCLNEVINPVASLDSMVANLRDVKCPRLKAIEVLPLKEYLKYSSMLQDTISTYNNKLHAHPYYIDDEYFKDIRMSVSNNSNYKKSFDKQVALCQGRYKKYETDMEQICKQKDPNTYIHRYCSYHPDFSAQIDAMYEDYKCNYTKENLATAVLNGEDIGARCQESLWNKYAYLYKDQEKFLDEYKKSANINQSISARLDIINKLMRHIRNNKIKTKGLYDTSKDTEVNREFRALCNKMRYLGIPFSKEVINLDPQAQKEYDKNGHFFSDTDEFYTAYITNSYKTILKEKQTNK